ncbi:ATP-binding protein [Methylobacterium nodulans]|uniref:Sensory/regulatory protein RpfC n=1 Tax=Methylobacterium nodulans (strain LMG 21967 / CNCM I-2342 / ORS 2060) TaxID=460265 RepID=B8IMS0_METNO|nr:ATP-binding protein [Methylobacterium nodulans]ACL60263.1 PAS/PAC sensor hybrid histidine kinase [Methylobacterium nodulans ORS 2060]
MGRVEGAAQTGMEAALRAESGLVYAGFDGLGTGIGLIAALLLVAIGWHARRLARWRREREIEHLHDRIWHLSESEERYRSLVEAQIEVIVQRDAEGRITFANEGFARLAGSSPGALLGTAQQLTVLDSTPVESRPDGTRAADVAVAPPEGGATRWFAFVETAVVGRDGRPEVLSAGREITERIEAVRSLDEARSRAEAASVAKSRFLATVSHEFRTPLNGILGMADLVLDTPLSPEQETYIRAVKTSGEALLSLIDGILDFSKIEAGRLDLAAEPFDPAGLVESVVELLAPRAQDKGLEIAADLAEDLPLQVVGDSDRVRQILLNLAGNAVKFTESGGVGVTAERAGAEIALTVRDTGPGIPEERLPLLFEEFEQGDGSASRRHEGTGLGLAITRRLVDRMGGRIEVTSRPDEGSCFRVVLPLRALGEERPRPPSLAGRRILVAAASAFEGPFLRDRLARAGAEVVAAETEAAARETLRGVGTTPCGPAPFDAVLADRALGDEAVRRIAGAAKRAGIPRAVVLLSPFDRRDFGSPGAAGFDRYLIKPVRARSLFAHLCEEARPPGGELRRAPGADRPAAARGRPRVLLAEDNPINALLARKALERLDTVVTWVPDGVEALRHLEAAAAGEAEGFDLALLDIRMPRLDGLEAARRLRAFERARGIPPQHLIAVTANVGAEDEAAARAAGFDGFLSKPLDLIALPALLAGPARAA